MRWVVLACAALSGCSALFGLEEPLRARDADVDDVLVDAPPDAPDALFDGMPDASLDAPGCPMTYAATAGRYYRLSTTQAGWAGAAADCADDSPTSHLVVIGTPAELTLVNNTFSDENEIWIGLSDRITDGTFLWVTTEDTMGYPPASGAPWQNLGTGPCVQHKIPDGFNTRDCGLTRRYLCECDGYPNDPSRY